MTNVMFKKPRFVVPEATKDKTIVDIVMFVAGTTDPINTQGLKHQANTQYWQASKENFWNKIKELKPQYLNLHIEGNFFSWSGDNDTLERNKAADRLLDLFVRVYPGFKRKEVHLHLVGHSHGGNVINQFTNLIATDKRFPELWKIKSITYLSTPFFKKKHQLNHAKIRKDCKIINVHNEYDLTQRLVADFSLVNLEVFLKNFNMANFEKGLKILEGVDVEALKSNLIDLWMSKEEGVIIWREMAKVFKGANVLTQEFIKYIQGINVNKPALDKERDGFVVILKSFLQWTFDVYNNYNNANASYSKAKFVGNLQLTQGVAVLNQLFDIKSSEKDSYILHLLARVFAENTGLTDSIEINSWTPADQAAGLSIQDINITTHDPYHSRGKKTICEGFITGTVGALQKNNLEEVLMRLFSQFIEPVTLLLVTIVIDKVIEPAVFGKLDTEITKLRKDLQIYSKLVTKYHAKLVAEKDKKLELMARPGTVPYLAMVSHSLSHTQFWPQVEQGLRGAFSSGKNPGYKKK